MNEAQRRHVSLAFVAVIVLFLGIYLTRIDYTRLSRLTIDWPMLVLATLSAMLFRYWGVHVWRVILRGLGTTSIPHFSILASIYAKAWMGRYVPGKVAWIAGRIYLARNLGISTGRLAVSAFLEGGMQIVALLAVSMLLLSLDPRLDVLGGGPKLVMIGIAVLCLVALVPNVFNVLVRKAYLLIKKSEPGPAWNINGRAVVSSFCLYAVGAILSGTSFYLLARSIDPNITGSLFIYCIGAYSLAGAVGMATPIVPSGIGVRDGVLLLLLTIVLPAEIAVVLTILSRLWMVAIDLMFYLATAITLQARSAGR